MMCTRLRSSRTSLGSLGTKSSSIRTSARASPINRATSRSSSVLIGMLILVVWSCGIVVCVSKVASAGWVLIPISFYLVPVGTFSLLTLLL